MELLDMIRQIEAQMARLKLVIANGGEGMPEGVDAEFLLLVMARTKAQYQRELMDTE